MSTLAKHMALPALAPRRRLLLALLVVGVAFSLFLTWAYVTRLNDQLAAARDYTRLHDLLRLRLPLTLYYGEHGRYPADLSALVPEYVGALPQDPLHGQIHRRRDCPAGGSHRFAYRYTVTGDGQHFTLEACLETGEEPVLRVVSYGD